MQALKAACDEAIAVLVSRTGQASAIWERLLAAVVVALSIPDDPSTARYDISYQLAEIEVMLFTAGYACLVCHSCCTCTLHVPCVPDMCIACHTVVPHFGTP